jgi:lactate racemase-like protein
VPRIPLLAGSRLIVVGAPDDAVVLRPPPPGEAMADVAAGVRDALRFPLSGPPLEELVRGARRVTIVVEQPALPIPSAPRDPRQAAIAATVDELERLGISSGYQTILVAGGLARRASQRELAGLVAPDFARRFHGHVAVHDAEDPKLVEVPVAGREVRVHPALVETDAVVVVGAAETVLHGGPAALLGATDAETLRAADAYSLLETSASGGWKLAVELEAALARRVSLLGVSLTLNTPVLGGVLQGYPYDSEAVRRIANFPLRGLFGLLPGAVRRGVLRRLPSELSAFAVFAGPPSVAHAEALLRGVESRSADLDERLDAVCIPIPHATPHLPREAPNPALAAYLGLGLALRLWRDSFPLVEGGTAILLSRFRRRFPHPTQSPYRALFQAIRSGGAREPEELALAERAAGADSRALDAYRASRSCHPLLPFTEWSGCQPAIGRLGAVLVAGCRDAHAARQLGFVPTHGVQAALAMARQRTDPPARIGFLLSPPYFPLRVRETPG